MARAAEPGWFGRVCPTEHDDGRDTTTRGSRTVEGVRSHAEQCRLLLRPYDRRIDVTDVA